MAASFGFSVKSDVRQVQRMLARAERRVVPVAAGQALNRVATSVRSAVVRDVSAEIGVKQKRVRDDITIHKASRYALTATVIAKGKRIPLKDLAARQTRQGVTYRGGKGQGRKLARGAFVVDKLGGHVFRRISKKRLPIAKQYGPSVPGKFVQQRAQQVMRARAAERWPVEFDRALRNQLRRIRAA